MALSKRIGKKRVYGLGMAWFAAAITVLSLLGHRLPVAFSLAMMAAAGVGMGLTYALPYAMVPDAIEYDYLLTGERTEGAFYGIWTFGLKIGQALALGISGAVLALTGYLPGTEQSPGALLVIRLLLGPIPAAVFVLALLTLRAYPIDEARYREILDAIRAGEAGARPPGGGRRPLTGLMRVPKMTSRCRRRERRGSRPARVHRT